MGTGGIGVIDLVALLDGGGVLSIAVMVAALSSVKHHSAVTVAVLRC